MITTFGLVSMVKGGICSIFQAHNGSSNVALEHCYGCSSLMITAQLFPANRGWEKEGVVGWERVWWDGRERV